MDDKKNKISTKKARNRDKKRSLLRSQSAATLIKTKLVNKLNKTSPYKLRNNKPSIISSPSNSRRSNRNSFNMISSPNSRISTPLSKRSLSKGPNAANNNCYYC